MRLDEKRLKQIGEQFGAQLTNVIGNAMLHSVEVGKVEETYAEVYEFEGDAPIRVPLLALNAGAAMLKILPKEGSTALILYANGRIEKPIFVGFTEVEEINVVVGESSVKITDGLIEFNGGENDGLVLSQKAVDRLNTIERDINTLKTAFAAWSPAPGDGGAVLFGLTESWAAQRLTETQPSDIENDKITQ